MSLKPPTSSAPLISTFPSSNLKEICLNRLGTGEGKVFDELVSLKSYASYLASREPARLRTVYNERYTVLAYRGRNLVLSKLQSGLNDLISDTWSRLLALSGGREIPVEVPVNMSEDLRSTTMGRSFIHDIPPPFQTFLSSARCQSCPGSPFSDRQKRARVEVSTLTAAQFMSSSTLPSQSWNRSRSFSR